MRVNEIFYSLQGEGYNTGRPAVFLRLSGCNLKCPFCDTDFSKYTDMSEEEIVDAICQLSVDCHFVVITGGEPTLQNCTLLIDMLHRNRYEVAMESNGTRPAPYNVDWLTISPKIPFVSTDNKYLDVKRCQELKLVFDGDMEPDTYGVKARHYYLQPCDTGDPERNAVITDKCIEYVKQHPKWKLSLQTQKILKVR